jgi:hypothetical protein
MQSVREIKRNQQKDVEKHCLGLPVGGDTNKMGLHWEVF